MATDHIRYDILAQDALRGMVRTVLEDIAKSGLPGEHHFYITFDTTADGVRLSQRMRAQYPEEMTVVLQHQFWDLAITEDGFEVGMSFGGVPERLYVPFPSIKAFVDPSVQFALQFQEIDADAAPADASKAAAPVKETGSKPLRVPGEQKKKRTVPTIAAVPPTVNSAPNPTSANSDDDPDKPKGGGEVVRLDRFRKK